MHYKKMALAVLAVAGLMLAPLAASALTIRIWPGCGW